MAPIPWRDRAVEKFLQGKDNTPKVWKEAAEVALKKAEPLADNTYKIPLTRGLLQKALRAMGEGGSK